MRDEYVPQALLALILTLASLASATFTFAAVILLSWFGLLGHLDLEDLASASQDGSTWHELEL